MKYEINKLCEVALAKIETTRQKPSRMFMQGILAGLFLGATMILSYSLGALFADNLAVSKTMISFSFGIGLVAICLLGAELFTGNCFTLMMPVYHQKLKFREILPTLGLCYVGNMIGMAFICAIFMISQKHSPLYADYLRPLFETKMNFDITSLFIKGILCNFAVCIGAYANIRVQDSFPKILLIFFFVAMFVLTGLEHCIANSGFFSMIISEYGIIEGVSKIPLHMLISTIANFVGGGVLLAYPIYFIIHDKDSIKE